MLKTCNKHNFKPNQETDVVNLEADSNLEAGSKTTKVIVNTLRDIGKVKLYLMEVLGRVWGTKWIARLTKQQANQPVSHSSSQVVHQQSKQPVTQPFKTSGEQLEEPGEPCLNLHLEQRQSRLDYKILQLGNEAEEQKRINGKIDPM